MTSAKETLEVHTILDLASTSARDYMLLEKSYAQIPLPQYFNFVESLKRVKEIYEILGPDRSFKLSTSAEGNRSHKILANKDGAYGWQSYELINPFVYCTLVRLITECDSWDLIKGRFAELFKGSRILCSSIPLYLVNDTEKQKLFASHELLRKQILRLVQKFPYMARTKIIDCYGSIYSHSIAWALHGKEQAKANRKSASLLGNQIDRLMQCINYGQTNGIPYGNIVSQLIVELVLAFGDQLITQRLACFADGAFEIIRNGDDFWVFATDANTAHSILQLMAAELETLNFKLDSHKTTVQEAGISSVVKINREFGLPTCLGRGLYERLAEIWEVSKQLPNSEQLDNMCHFYLNDLKEDRFDEYEGDYGVLISIIADIMCENPRVIPDGTDIILRFMFCVERERQDDLLEQVYNKMVKVPFSYLTKLWLQRIAVQLRTSRGDDDRVELPGYMASSRDESLCLTLDRTLPHPWDFDWMLDPKNKKGKDVLAQLSRENIDKIRELIDKIFVVDRFIFSIMTGDTGCIPNASHNQQNPSKMYDFSRIIVL